MKRFLFILLSCFLIQVGFTATKTEDWWIAKEYVNDFKSQFYLITPTQLMSLLDKQDLFLDNLKIITVPGNVQYQPIWL